MSRKKEAIHIIVAILIMSIILSFANYAQIITIQGALAYLNILIYSTIIILATVFAKKAKAYNIDVKIEHKIIQWKRWWIYKKSHFKKPLPGGIIFPVLFALISNGWIKILAFLQFDAKALPTKVARKRRIKTYADLMEWDVGIIAFFGLVASLAIAIIASYAGLTDLAKISLYYSLWNLLPIGQLDGIKIFFGSKPTRTDYIHLFPPLYIFSLLITAITAIIVLL